MNIHQVFDTNCGVFYYNYKLRYIFLEMDESIQKLLI